MPESDKAIGIEVNSRPKVSINLNVEIPDGLNVFALMLVMVDPNNGQIHTLIRSRFQEDKEHQALIIEAIKFHLSQLEN